MISAVITFALLAQVPAPTPIATQVEGTVINDLNGEPIRNANVILHAHDDDQGVNYADETDSNGHFAIGDIEPGDYSVSAQHVGFFEQSQGARGAPPPRVKVDKGQQVSGIVLRLAPAGVISGRVLDADGDPVLGAVVRARRSGYTEGKKQLNNIEWVRSNADGEFRLFGLRAGTYYVQASYFRRRRDGKPEGIPTYYPGSADENHATPVVLRPGGHLQGYDIRLQTAGLHSVRFKFPESHALEGAYNVTLINQQGIQTNLSAYISQTEVVFPGVPSGSYDAVLNITNRDQETYAIQHVEVTNADVDGGTLTILPPSELSGSVRVEGGALSQFQKVHINLEAEYPLPFMGSSSAEVKPDGWFLLKNAVPRVYEVTISRTPGLYLKSVWIGDKQLPGRRVDLTTKSEPIAVVLGSDVGNLEGSVHNTKGEPAARVRVTATASGGNSGRTDLSRFAFTDEKGTFKIKDVAPGDYKVFAWENVPEGAPEDPEFRKPFEKQAANVRMQPNGHEKVQVTTIPAAATKGDDQ